MAMNKQTFLVRLALGSLWVLGVMSAQAQMSMQDATQQGNQLGTSLNPNIYQGITTSNPVDVVPQYNPAEPAQTQYFQGGQGSIVAPGTARVAACASQSDPECQAVNLMSKGPQTRPQFTIANDDPLLTRVRGLTANAGSLAGDMIGDIFSTYDTCTTTTTTTSPIYETQVCDEFATLENTVCKMGQEVIVDPNYAYKCLETIQSQSNATCNVGRVVQVDAVHTYQCQKSVNKLENLTCNRVLIVNCTWQGDYCAPTGITPGTVVVTNGNYTFKIVGGTITLENNITAVNSRTQATFEFDIQGANKLGVFEITEIHSDNWVGLVVNGTYIGTHSRYFLDNKMPTFNRASDRLELVDKEIGVGTGFIIKQVQYGPGPNDYANPETGLNFTSSESVDLRPYLVEGGNKITMYVINGGGPGNGTVTITANQKCEPLCEDSWDNQCASLEARSN